ncbi:MAG: hypothetical protein KIS91_01315 [Anaerolineae bacterium]|nr:hypothetical protein [Anaerolineae bacterium]
MPVMRQRIDRYAQDRAIGLCVGAVSVVDEDARLARDVARRAVAMYLPVVADLDPTFEFDPDELARIKAGIDHGDVVAAAHAVSDDLLGRFAFGRVAGRPGTSHRGVGRRRARRAWSWARRMGWTSPAALRLLARRVLPAFRE